jgi:hypothetical protein
MRRNRKNQANTVAYVFHQALECLLDDGLPILALPGRISATDALALAFPPIAPASKENMAIASRFEKGIANYARESFGCEQ